MNKLLLSLSFIIVSGYAGAENEISHERLETLAKNGDLASQIKLASAYRKGIGVTQDYKTAVKWFTLAAQQGLGMDV